MTYRLFVWDEISSVIHEASSGEMPTIDEWKHESTYPNGVRVYRNARHALALEVKARQRRGTSGPRYRKPTPEEERARLHSYSEGRSKADSVSLNRQVNRDDRNKIS